ncbi:unnamed protein product [Chilo suppressalis]|uniref:Uncharacterized protein n=1 Tax=Chilo suppressalis TaxID=168631 RepID=A0ABN8ASX7_CHISP|nr:unnamed protein product [Chilo suppressalis]
MSFKCRKIALFLLAFLRAYSAFRFKVDGMLSIELKGIEVGNLRAHEERDDKRGNVTVKKQKRIKIATPPPMLECIYQYPERNQTDAMLSNMMNELTKIFMRAHKLVHHGTGTTKIVNKRYRVIDNKSHHFFGEVFANMTQQYRQFYNRTLDSMTPPRDPCDHQLQLKSLWGELLDYSLLSLQNATVKCMDEYLRVQNRSDDSQIKRKLGKYLRGEIQRARSDQLGMLCDTFQLCYSELL